MFPSISKFCGERRENQSIVSKLEGTLLISFSYFPYFMLVAFEAGSPVRALLLLLVSPLLWLLQSFCFETLAVRIMISIALLGIRVNDVKAVAKAVLPRFYLEDLSRSAFGVFSTYGGKKYVVTSIPRIMVETFLREYLNVDFVVGTEVRTLGGYCLRLVAEPCFMGSIDQSEALKATLGDDKKIDIGLGDALNDHPFMMLCQESYIVPLDEKSSPLHRSEYPKPLIFHDGRLVAKPTPSDSLAVLLWLPMGILLAISRILVGTVLPYKFGLMAAAATGMRVRTKFPPISHTFETNGPCSHCTCESCDPPTSQDDGASNPSSPTTGPIDPKGKDLSFTSEGTCNTLYVCSHRTLIDPLIVASTLQRHVLAVTYSVSRVSELLSPIRTVRLSRDRAKDGEMMRMLLKKGDLVVCPEGTTCREPYLLRFSPLFAEIADVIVPVAISAKGSMFHGTAVRGHKCFDSLFFLMNPNPDYRIEFLEKLSGVRTCKSPENSSYNIANHVQQMIGQALGFECTNFTRRDKYRMLAGNDGVDLKT